MKFEDLSEAEVAHLTERFARSTPRMQRQIMAKLAFDKYRMERGLDELVKLQAHYAKLLNEHDGGKRHEFRSGEEWLQRLDETEGAEAAAERVNPNACPDEP